jgi:DNA mismatch repair protein MutL
VQVLAQTRNTYIVAQSGTALLVIDQHIAHERILYERFVRGAQGGGVAVQHLMMPITLELTRREAMVVEKRLPELARAGFELEPFGGDSFLVRAVPASVAQKRLKAQGGPEEVLREIVDDMVEQTVSRRLLLPAEEVLITASCKMAVKAGDPLTLAEMQALVDDLFLCENPYTCPHGRPILLEMSNSEVDRKFGR